MTHKLFSCCHASPTKDRICAVMPIVISDIQVPKCVKCMAAFLGLVRCLLSENVWVWKDIRFFYFFLFRFICVV